MTVEKTGETWNNTQLLGEIMRNSWRLWEYDWQVPAEPGKVTLRGPGDGFGRPEPTHGVRSGSMQLHREPPFADRGRYTLTHAFNPYP